MKTLQHTIIPAALALLFVLAAPPLRAEVIWLEAESFEDTGGWANDPQFVDVMGSPYLLANGVDAPVEDAVTRARIPAGGPYRLWVRCKDWLPEHSPGQFRVWVNGKPSETAFGESDSAGWKWVDGGMFDLPSGRVEIRLEDLTGWWGRCDAVVLSSGDEFKPSDDLLTLERQRIRHFDPYGEVDETRPCDVVVVGGGLAGSAAAVAAARHGFEVVLIQDRPVLGGNASSEIDVPPGGDNSREPLDPGETGIIEEFYPKADRGFEYDWSSGIEAVVRAEPNIGLRLDTRAINVLMKDPDTIEAVVAVDTRTGKRVMFPGKIFIDCTGDGWVGFWAGAVFRKGREARAEFGESLAPEAADSRTMGNTLMVAHFDDLETGPFLSPEWAHNRWKSPEDFENAGTHFALDRELYPAGMADRFANRFTYGAGIHGQQFARPAERASTGGSRFLPKYGDHYKQYEKGSGYRPRDKNGGFFQWYVELGGMMDTIHDAEAIRDELFRVNLGLWNYVKNYDPAFKEENMGRRLIWINHIAGKRESRRLVGDYILTQWDYENETVHGDNVAYGGWGIDVHHPNGYWKSGPMYYSAYRDRKVSIPFRALYSKNVDNLMMAGRNISVSHVALGGVRVMRTTCLMGQAAGTAAAVCLERNAPPRDVGRDWIGEVQQRLLRDGAYVMGQTNQDPDDLALKATASASSVKRIPDPNLSFAASGTPLTHDLNMQRAVMFKPGRERIETLALRLRSKNGSPTKLTVTLRPAEAFGDFSSNENLARAEAVVPPNGQSWVRFGLNADVDPDRYYYAFLPPAEGLQWDLFPQRKDDACRAYGGPGWTRRDECYAYSLDPEGVAFEPAPDVALEPGNVIDGFNRAVNGVPHSWGPDPAEELPQWIELAWDLPQTFDTVYVTFQTLAHASPEYRLEIETDGEWKEAARVENAKRREKVSLGGAVTAQRLRLVLESRPENASADGAQICEIRVYRESDRL